MGSIRQKKLVGKKESQHNAVLHALDELKKDGVESPAAEDAGSESDESMEAAVFTPPPLHGDKARTSSSKVRSRSEESKAEQQAKAEKEQIQREERDRKAAAGLFDDVSGTKQAELDMEAAEAAEAIKALGSERAAGNMLMKHLLSGNAPVIHERYYPHLME